MTEYRPVYGEDISLRSFPKPSHERLPPYDQNDNQPLISTGATESLGVGSTKPLVDWPDVLSLVISVICCGLASAAVGSDRLAWQLGYDYQLVVVGFLLSIMAFCLAYVAPNLFLRLEIRFGNSTLQNFDALKTNSPMGDKLDWWWRIALWALMALPLGLSASYKLFAGGQASAQIHIGDNRYNDTWGMHVPPGVLPLGWNTGLMAMYNASMPFLQASTNSTSRTDPTYDDPANELPLPDFPQAYGFNTLLLSNKSAALLDAPPPDWITGTQKRLAQGESLDINATVLATVATYNASVDEHRDPNDPWWNALGPGEGEAVPFGTDWQIWCYYNNQSGASTSNDDSWFFLGLYNVNQSWYDETKMYDVKRQECHGTWRLTVGNIELLGGHCDTDQSAGLLSERSQMIFNHNRLFIRDFYFPAFTEYLAPFQTRYHGHWLMPTLSVTLASAFWSRVAAMNGPSSPHWMGNDSYSFFPKPLPRNSVRETVSGAGLLYKSNSSVYLHRPALRKSPWLFLVLAMQPLLTVATIVANVLLYSVPASKDFGLLAIMAGARKESLGLLQGAGFSAALRSPVHVGIEVTELGGRHGSVSYLLGHRRQESDAQIKRLHHYR